MLRFINEAVGLDLEDKSLESVFAQACVFIQAGSFVRGLKGGPGSQKRRRVENKRDAWGERLRLAPTTQTNFVTERAAQLDH